ncbi:MAG TPA: precorrin-3B C(17)-methyltransferase [Acidimicrobiales bacterium]
MTVLTISVTERGRLLAKRLPFEHTHGDVGATVRARWSKVDALVLVLATGAAVRIVAPLLEDKRVDPAVVCLDEAGRFAVALCGGHLGGANTLARQVAALVGAEPVVTTATDATGTCPLDALPGFIADGDVAGVTAAMLDGRAPLVDNDLSWPLPSTVPVGAGPERLVITDRRVEPGRHGVAVLRPPTLVAGIGTSTGAPPDEVVGLLGTSLAEAGLDAACVAEVATIDRRADEPALHAFGGPLRLFPAETLRRVRVPTPSGTVDSAVGTPSVAEAAALLAAGPGAELVITKRTSAHAAVAVARRRRPRGHLAIVGLGPGDPRHRTPAAEAAVRHADIVIGYGPYVEQCADLIGPHHQIVRSPIGDEEDRARQAVEQAGSGRRVALVSSGDAGVYAMASVALEQATASEGAASAFNLDVVPGITAATAAAAALGAPLGHDHAAISLSDLLTPWATIESRLQAVAAADLVVSLYNPRSRGRPWQLDAARRILLEHRVPSTPVGVATDLFRNGERVRVTTLADLDPEEVGMTTCVVVGSSATRVVDGRMVTPRGYRP